MSQTFQPNVTILDATAISHFLTTSTASEILNELMVEDWQWTNMYDQYYESCHPLECRYTVKTRNDVVYIVTTVIGLIGGLVIALKLIVPRLVHFSSYLQRRREITVTTIAIIEDRFG